MTLIFILELIRNNKTAPLEAGPLIISQLVPVFARWCRYIKSTFAALSLRGPQKFFYFFLFERLRLLLNGEFVLNVLYFTHIK
jgi:hypothetical protein